jgi:hypothetical protein
MSRYFFVYVGERAAGNLKIGLDHLVWGWKNPWYGGLASESADMLKAPGSDAYLVLAQVAKPNPAPEGWPRTQAGDLDSWQRAGFQSLTIGRIARPLYESDEQVWPDAIYPYRVDLDNLVVKGDVAGTDLDEDAVRMIRESAMRRGNAIAGPAPLTPSAEVAVENSHEITPDRLLAGLDGLNGQALTLVRREQSKLRKDKLKGATIALCTLCGRALPVGLLRLAHIKRRAVCTPQECRNPHNTMLACTLGCDELFERGYIGVAAGRVIASSESSGWTESVHAVIKPMLDADVTAYLAGQEKFLPGIAPTTDWADGVEGDLSNDRGAAGMTGRLAASRTARTGDCRRGGRSCNRAGRRRLRSRRLRIHEPQGQRPDLRRWASGSCASPCASRTTPN